MVNLLVAQLTYNPNRKPVKPAPDSSYRFDLKNLLFLLIFHLHSCKKRNSIVMHFLHFFFWSIVFLKDHKKFLLTITICSVPNQWRHKVTPFAYTVLEPVCIRLVSSFTHLNFGNPFRSIAPYEYDLPSSKFSGNCFLLLLLQFHSSFPSFISWHS